MRLSAWATSSAPYSSGMQIDSSTTAKEGTRTPEKHERPAQRPGPCSVEPLTAYSHSTQVADLRLCRTVALTSPVYPETEREALGSLRDHLDERDIVSLITAYREVR